MQSKELRIGNYIECFGNVEIVDQIGSKDVNEVVCDFVKFKNKSTGTWLIHDNKDLAKPIIITKEWLIKFEFYQIDNYKFSHHEFDIVININDFECVICENIWLDVWFNNRKIKYVHELQNLYFALTGEELELKNESKP